VAYLHYTTLLQRKIFNLLALALAKPGQLANLLCFAQSERLSGYNIRKTDLPNQHKRIL
jgi:hypothetical protein